MLQHLRLVVIAVVGVLLLTSRRSEAASYTLLPVDETIGSDSGIGTLSIRSVDPAPNVCALLGYCNLDLVEFSLSRTGDFGEILGVEFFEAGAAAIATATLPSPSGVDPIAMGLQPGPGFVEAVFSFGAPGGQLVGSSETSTLIVVFDQGAIQNAAQNNRGGPTLSFNLIEHPTTVITASNIFLQPVPEPGVLGLTLVGVLVLTARRLSTGVPPGH
jgi:hypothetical protein